MTYGTLARIFLTALLLVGALYLMNCFIEVNATYHALTALPKSADGNLQARAHVETLMFDMRWLAIAFSVASATVIGREILSAKIDSRIGAIERWLTKPKELPEPRERNATLAGIPKVVQELGTQVYESRRREQLLLERAVDVICTLDREGFMINVSPSARNSWGYFPEELVGKSLGYFLNPDDAKKLAETLRQPAREVDNIFLETQVRRKDSTMLDVGFNGYRWGSDSRMFCIVHDMSRLKNAEMRIRQRLEQVRATLQRLPVGVILVDRNGKIEFANQEAQVVLGYQSDEIERLKLTDIIEQPIDMDEIRAHDTSVRSAIVCKDYSNKIADIWVAPVEVDDGERKLLVTFLDQTEQEAFERTKQEFIAMVTHDLRSPLTTILGMLQLLEVGVLGQINDKGRRIAAGAKKECDRLIRLLNDMLALDQIEAGAFQLQCGRVNISATVRDALTNVQMLAQAKQLSLHTNIKELTCWGDDQRLMQVLMNLLTNAIKFAPVGSRIAVETTDLGPHIMVAVQDEGPGIHPDKLDKIFEKFEQATIADSRQRGGTGLGLAICKAIIEQHGGRIAVESIQGHGSRFWFTVPKQAQMLRI